jgi:hypothetical protein
MWATVQMAIQLGLLGLSVAVILQAPKPDASAEEVIFVYAHTKPARVVHQPRRFTMSCTVCAVCVPCVP